jgi:hypothetical protein
MDVYQLDRTDPKGAQYADVTNPSLTVFYKIENGLIYYYGLFQEWRVSSLNRDYKPLKTDKLLKCFVTNEDIKL